jgi:hypothetical protein
MQRRLSASCAGSPPQLQLMRAEHPTGNRVEDLSAFSRRLKQLARELDRPVIAVSQLDRGIEQRPGGSDHLDGQPPPLPTDRGGRLGRRVCRPVDRCSSTYLEYLTCSATGEESISILPRPSRKVR